MGQNKAFNTCLILYIVHLASTAPVADPAPMTAVAASPSDVTVQLHEQLIAETIHLNQVEKTTLDSYKLDRFQDPDATSGNINIVGLPLASQLSVNVRLVATEEDLLATHVENINVYTAFLIMITSDESILYKDDINNYVDELQQLSMLTTRVVNKMKSIINEENLHGKSLANNEDMDYKTITNKSTLNVVTLKVLEEYYLYLVISERDFDTMLYNHKDVPV